MRSRTWDRIRAAFAAACEIGVDGGDVSATPDGYIVDLRDAAGRRPFRVFSTPADGWWMQRGFLFWAGKMIHFPTQQVAPPGFGAAWTLSVMAPDVSLITGSLGPGLWTSKLSRDVDWQIEVAQPDIVGGRVIVKEETDGSLSVTPATLRWPIASLWQGRILQHSVGHLILDLASGGRLHRSNGYPFA